METNDTQIDFLIRRYASESGVSARSEHLDADELNAFAEGKLPIAARSRYVSHLADCRDCRRLATQLSLSAGAVSKVDVAASEEIPQSWWRRLNIFLAPPAIRYAAFAMVVLIAAGIAFVTFRRPNPPANDLVAESGAPETSVSALKPSNASASPVNQVAKSAATPLAGNSKQRGCPGALVDRVKRRAADYARRAVEGARPGARVGNRCEDRGGPSGRTKNVG